MRILLREHQKTLSDQRKFDAQLKNAQLPAGQQIDNRIDLNLDAKVKSIIKETVKSQSIKKENLTIDECDLTCTESGSRSFSQSSSNTTKRANLLIREALWNNALSRNKTFDKKV